ncbi:alkaline phosphatase family protein [Candidatus Nitrosocosmicus franklandus]|uniref:Cofactor-independent phosphoglycerate mutase n=1 Tax=Candidatus Nitrosocosmicus franklandianus TaxID=1798806 RepID=A0A484IF26_9ARCH|nr:alkaline phosphatase family protein [Candidatus Nitrosocosmicus franklandus]VFJ15437.1 Cofactor-independent phosphoglycerate mutase [Candidatus Nitrosocosmicus franklandus]
MTKARTVYVLLDGVGDLPHPDLNDLTPLEAAYTPHLDKIARMGVSGKVISVGDGIAPQSDIAVFNMLGYNFKDVEYFGRGVVECIGCGIDFVDGDLALRGNFATIEGTSKKIIDRRAGRNISKEDSNAICKLIRENVKLDNVEYSIEPTIGHRVVLRFRRKGLKLGQNITNTDPAYDKVNGIGIALDTSNSDLYVTRSQARDENSRVSSEIVNDFSDKVIDILDGCQINKEREQRGLLPINCILMRDAGNKYPFVADINKKYGLSFASLVDMPVEIGISKIVGMKAYEGGSTNDYDLKAKTLLKILKNHDLIYVHIKGPDEFGHDGDARGKKRNIEEIDKHFFKILCEGLEEIAGEYDTRFIICGDHSTPCIKKAHTDDPIPLLISGKGLAGDGTTRFTESNSKRGSIGKIYGYKVIEEALRIFNRDNNRVTSG